MRKSKVKKPKWVYFTMAPMVLFGWGKLNDAAAPIITWGKIFLEVPANEVWERVLEYYSGYAMVVIATNCISIMLNIAIGLYILCNFWRLSKGWFIVRLCLIGLALELISTFSGPYPRRLTMFSMAWLYPWIRYVFLAICGYAHGRLAKRYQEV